MEGDTETLKLHTMQDHTVHISKTYCELRYNLGLEGRFDVAGDWRIKV